MSQAITPTSSSNKLLIEADLVLSNSAAAGTMVVALFQDSTVNALAASAEAISAATGLVFIRLSHTMSAGTTSSTTFKIRAGLNVAGTTTFNGAGAARLFGAITKSSMYITEYRV